MRYVIIGMGAAGISAAEAIRSSDKDGEILVVSEEPDGYYSRPGLAYVLSGEIPEKQLFPFLAEDFDDLRIKRVTARAERIDPAAHRIHFEDGKSVVYDKLLLATGAQARIASVPGAELEGVVKLDNIGDSRRILKQLRRARRAVVVGGGITALELVEGLLSRGVKVHYFLRGERYWGSVLDETESKIVEHRLQEEGVHLHYHTELDEILGKPSGLLGRGARRVTGVLTKDGKTLPCDLVAVAIGIAPRILLAQQSGLAVERGVLVNDCLQTSHPDIYAAGDVAEIHDPETGIKSIDSLWGIARDKGTVAGLNMAGAHIPYVKRIPFNVTRLVGLTTTIIGSVGAGGQDADLVGINRGSSETWGETPEAGISQNHFDVNRIRLVVGKKHVLGALIMGDQTLSQPIKNLVANKTDISPIRAALLDSNADIGALIARFGV